MRSLEITDLKSFRFPELQDGVYTSYQLHFALRHPVSLKIGKLGSHAFPEGDYIYTGSARTNLRTRLLRHISVKKKPHWHIDYLLSDRGISFIKIILSRMEECELNRRTPGRIVVRGFGSSDCRAGCGSHLKLTIDDANSTNRRPQKA